MLAGSSPGGGTDQTVRLLARHLERYIPGKPTILVVNKPGAGGMIAINELYNLRKPDGLTMSNINTGAIFAVAGGNDAIKFDLQKFSVSARRSMKRKLSISSRRRLTRASMRSERPTKRASSRDGRAIARPYQQFRREDRRSRSSVSIFT